MGPILGISPLDKDATASLYLDGEWRAIAEERLSRKKLHKGFPRRAVEQLLASEGIAVSDIEVVVYPFRPWWMEAARITTGYCSNLRQTAMDDSDAEAKRRHLASYAGWCRESILAHRRYNAELRTGLEQLGWKGGVQWTEHHAAHTAGAYLTSGFEEALCITLDWYGGGLSGAVTRCGRAAMKTLAVFRYPHSLGLFYAQVTGALGFRMSRHEGKVVGLAGYGDPGELGRMVLDRFRIAGGRFRYPAAMDGKFIRELAAAYSRHEVAAACQFALDKMVTGIAAYWISRTGLTKVVLSGGVTANVKTNQRICELDSVKEVFVHPNMGDGGTGVGATAAHLFQQGRIGSIEWKTCFLGPEYADSRISRVLAESGVESFETMARPAERIAALLAGGNVVARFDGRMEYGPRALGNRSILCTATDPAVNDWLNRRLGRSEFMPFAPVTLASHCEARYGLASKQRLTGRFMTATTPCTHLMKRESPAAVHVDGTARPLFLHRDDNEGLYEIVEAYYRLTGIPTLINTSFNMHEEPIVCSPEDAVRVFLKGHLDYLAIGSWLVAHPALSRPVRRHSEPVLGQTN
jgi:carbamoyltransferase